jgi:hypothetical protein
VFNQAYACGSYGLSVTFACDRVHHYTQNFPKWLCSATVVPSVACHAFALDSTRKSGTVLLWPKENCLLKAVMPPAVRFILFP